jgi:hypothetical protein
MSKYLFRKIALERLSSPEQLDQLLHVTSPRTWIATVAFLLLIGMGVTWACIATIPESITEQCIVVSMEPNTDRGTRTDTRTSAALVPLNAYDHVLRLYVPYIEAKRLQPGMAVEISPTMMKRSQYGNLRGRIADVDDRPIDPTALSASVGTSLATLAFWSEGPAAEVGVQLLPDNTNRSDFGLSPVPGRQSAIAPPMICTARIITGRIKPISLLLPFVREKMRAH